MTRTQFEALYELLDDIRKLIDQIDARVATIESAINPPTHFVTVEGSST